jgi:predicted anti-sigma-YlaC factor YlaD
MKYECEMISDLLPLYKDDICSEASKKIVSEHLAECPACSDLLNKMNDISIDEEIISEKNEVISSQAKFFKRKSALAGLIVAAVFALPVLICFIADLLGGGNFGWFFRKASQAFAAFRRSFILRLMSLPPREASFPSALPP